MQHAHQKGLIHRDLKPSNILVTVRDGAPVPKVIDFGVAKATQGRLTDLTQHTAQERIIGTPVYMSPEQAAGGADIDTRSDIYSLGVLLYELLAGRTPFEAGELTRARLSEMRRVIRERDPLKPSTVVQSMTAEMRTSVSQRRRGDPAKLRKTLQGDLDWIVMKALEKNPARRYQAASALAAEVRRYLALSSAAFSDLAPLRDLPLDTLDLRGSGVTDLSPLAGCASLQVLRLPAGAEKIGALRDLPNLKEIGCDALEAPVKFWK